MAGTRRLKSIRLGAREWALRYRRPSSMAGAAGLCHYDKATLDIAIGQSPMDEADTVLHEVFHAIRYCQGRDYGDEVEEDYVRSLSTGLIVALKDNPEFALWLSHQLNLQT